MNIPFVPLSPDPSYVLSPGRFFAANELKAMVAHVVMNYDVKLEKEGEVPPPMWVATSLVPNPTASVYFRRRQS